MLRFKENRRKRNGEREKIRKGNVEKGGRGEGRRSLCHWLKGDSRPWVEVEKSLYCTDCSAAFVSSNSDILCGRPPDLWPYDFWAEHWHTGHSCPRQQTTPVLIFPRLLAFVWDGRTNGQARPVMRPIRTAAQWTSVQVCYYLLLFFVRQKELDVKLGVVEITRQRMLFCFAHVVLMHEKRYSNMLLARSYQENWTRRGRQERNGLTSSRGLLWNGIIINRSR